MTQRIKFFLTALFMMVVVTHCNSEQNIQAMTNFDTPIKAEKLENSILSFEQQGFISYKQLIEELKQGNVIFLGETHDSKTTHEYQAKILEALHKSNKIPAIAMEMFDRDVQQIINEYLAGNLSEADFIKQSRAWRNYNTDYKPLIDFAKANHLSVIAMNVPGNVIKKITKDGRNAIARLSHNEKMGIATEIDFDSEDYQKYFFDILPKGHPNIEEMKGRLLVSASVKDDTMAESITNFIQEPQYNGQSILVVNGKFHSDYGLAIPNRVLKRKGDLKLIIISFIPIEKNEMIGIKKYLSDPKMADFVIFTDDRKSFKLNFSKKKS